MNQAERIYVSSTSAGDPASPLAAEELARRIEDDIATLGLTPGCALGSLRELTTRYQSGRSVIREAIGLLERRGLGRLRPGPGGGFILAKPKPESIGAELADYFRAVAVTEQQLQDAHEALAFMQAHRETDYNQLLSPLVNCLERLAVEFSENSKSPNGNPSSSETAGWLPESIARRLMADIARTGRAGVRLGSEWDLCERFNVGRLTLRQAIRLLQDRGLVECRRGRGNGLMITDRRAAGNIRLVLAYLIGERLDPLVAGTILFQLNAMTPALAISRADTDQRRQLESALARVENVDSFERFDLLRLVHCVSRLADSPVIDLFSRCFAAYEARFHPSFAETLPATAQANYFHLIRQLLEHIPVGKTDNLEWAKGVSADLMYEMSQRRPL